MSENERSLLFQTEHNYTSFSFSSHSLESMAKTPSPVSALIDDFSNRSTNNGDGSDLSGTNIEVDFLKYVT